MSLAQFVVTFGIVWAAVVAAIVAFFHGCAVTRDKQVAAAFAEYNRHAHEREARL